MRGMKQWGSLVVSMVLLALISGTAWAHKASDSFIYLNQDRGEIRIDVALRDVAVALPLDRNGDRQLSGAELRAGRDQITRWVERGDRKSVV